MTDDPAVEPIAIIGLACRLPGARDAEQFWQNLVNGVESIKTTTLAEQAALGVPESMLSDPAFVPAAAYLDDYEHFDAAYFGMSPREAELRDPQHRLLLELAHTTLEDAGYDSTRYRGDIGVYVGCGDASYEWRNVRRNRRIFNGAGELAVAVNTHPAFLSTFLSYQLDLRGPSLSVGTACSTALVTLHLACEALRSGECDMALSGAASVDLPLGWGYVYAEGGVHSSDGHIRAFDAAAEGTIWGNGGGMVLLKPLSAALRDGDHVRAVVLGNAINNDGADRAGYTSPSQQGQTAVIAQALGVAGVDPTTITYVEAHGTGTELGDPIELAALGAAYQRDPDPDAEAWCAIGSVKPNIGHLGPAAGIASVIKVVLAIENGLLPPTLHFEKLNPRIDPGPFWVNAALSPWKANGSPRRAGVSSFGMGGTNGHIVMAEPPVLDPVLRPAGQQPHPAHLIALSARTEAGLAESARRLAAHLTEDTGHGPRGAVRETDLGDVSYTLRVGRRQHTHRLAVVAGDPAGAATALGNAIRRGAGTVPATPPRVALMFSGQGAQYAGMGAQLYVAEPVFRAAVDECADLLLPEIGVDLRTALLDAGDEAERELGRTELAQPALFTVCYALARLWRSWGLDPAAMVGHSIGEYVAATVAGVFELADALRVVAARGRLMQGMPPGKMLAVRLDEDELRPRLPADVSVAAVNGPGATVVAGPPEAIEKLAAELADDDIGARALRTSHAFHSVMMEPVLAAFRAVVAQVPLKPPAQPFLSNVTGTWITAAEATDPSYWARHLREPVRFAGCLDTLLEGGAWHLVECGPGRQLAGLAKMHKGGGVTALASLPHRGEKKSEVETLYGTASQLWVAGVNLDLQAVGPAGRRVPLPTYPWERSYHWVKPDTHDHIDDVVHDERRRPLDQWFAVPAWRQLPPAAPAEPLGRCLLFADLNRPGGPLPDGTEVILVRPGAAYSRDDGGYTIRPAVRADYDALLADLAGSGGVPRRIVHAWPLSDTHDPSGWQTQDRGFFSLLNLTQALAGVGLEGGVELVALTAGTQDVTGSDLVCPQHATVAGIAAVVPLELPWLTARHIDLDPAADWPHATPADAARLAAELSAEPVEGAVAIRAGRRWQREFQPVPAGTVQAEPVPGGLRESGTYLITGGLGGIGSTLAEDLATRLRARLVLVSRTALPPREEWDAALTTPATAHRVSRAIAAIRRMEAAGAQVLVAAADVTDEADLRLVREQALDRFGQLDGIVHTAGVPGGGMAEVKDREAAEQVLRPKIAGTLALRAVFGDLPLDFVMLCSSAYALAGGFGQVDYCAANQFLDAYAASDHGWRAPVVSVNWGGWSEVGVAAEVAAPAVFRALQRGDRRTPIDSDLLTARHAGDGDEQDWCGGTVATTSHWLLDEHRVGGVPVLPGTSHLEVARQAFQAVSTPPAPGQAVELRDVVLRDPLTVPEGAAAEVRVEFAPTVDGLAFTVLSQVGEARRTHAEGRARWVDAAGTSLVDLAAVKARCSLVTETVDPAGASPHWGNLRTVHGGQDEELALLEAGSATAADLHRWVLHPALLDEATGRGDDGSYWPAGFARVTVRGPLPARFWAHLRHRDPEGDIDEVRASDLSLLDESGRELVTISRFTSRRVDAERFAAELRSGTPQVAAAAPAAAAQETQAGGDPSVRMRPAEGAECFRRLAGADLGPQVVVSVLPIDRLITDTRRLTQETIEEDLVVGAAGGAAADSGAAGLDAPRTEVEAGVARIWAEVLGRPIGVDEDLFDAGGNSLNAVQFIAMARKELGVRLPMRSIFEMPTVAALAGHVETLRAEQKADAIPVLARAGRTTTTGRTA